MRQRSFAGSGPKRQQGVAAIFAAVALIGILVSTLLVIEMGRIYGAHRQLQKLASLAALDGARLISGCGLAPTLAAVQAAVDASVARNRGNAEIRGVVIEAGRVQTEPEEGLRQLQITGLDTADALRVTLTAPFPGVLTGFLPQSARLLTASATAQQPVVGMFSVGASLARLDAGVANALLSALLGGNVSLTAVDYERLAGVRLSAADLGIAFDLSVKDLADPVALGAETPVLSEALDGLANALAQTANSGVVTLLRQLGSAAGGNTTPVPLAEVLGTVADVAPEVAYVGALDLVIAMAAATHADASGGATPLAVPLNVSIPNVTRLRGFVQILEPAQASRAGPPRRTRAQTAAVRVLLRLQVDARENIERELNTLLLGMGRTTAPPFNLGVDLQVARAVATLDELGCPVPAQDPVARLSAQPSVGMLTVGTYAGSPDSAPPLSQGRVQIMAVRTDIVGGLVAQIRTNVFMNSPISTTLGSGTPRPLPRPVTEFTPQSSQDSDSRQRPWWTADQPVAGNPQTVGTTEALSGGLRSLSGSLDITASDPDRPDRNTQVCILLTTCIPVGSLLDAVVRGTRNTSGPVLADLSALDRVFNDLLTPLGLRVGAATVTMRAVQINPPQAVSKDRPPVPATP